MDRKEIQDILKELEDITRELDEVQRDISKELVSKISAVQEIARSPRREVVLEKHIHRVILRDNGDAFEGLF